MKSTKTASARVLLALAVAALALGGCGGGSSDTSSSSASGSEPSSASSSSPSEPGARGSGGSGTGAPRDATGGPGAGAPSPVEAVGGGSTDPGGSPSAGAKHGPSVPQPTGAPEPGITPEQRRNATVASLTLQSPSSQSSGGGPQSLPAVYTCDGKNTSPALRWQGVPEETAELVLFAMNVQPVDGKLFFDWAVAGLSPELEEIEAGKLPKGAVVGRNSFGKASYEICPEGAGETYIFTVFAVPKKLSPRQGFEPMALRRAVAEASGSAGLLALSYTRG